MSYDESFMLIGFNNGTVITLITSGLITNSFSTGRTAPIIQLDSFPNYIVALDSASNLYVWNTNKTVVLNQTLPFPASNVALSYVSIGPAVFGSVNYGTFITEYSLFAGFI